MLISKTLLVALLCLVSAVAAVSVAAQEPTFAYETVIPGYYLSSGRGITADDAGNAYVVGRWVGDQGQSNIIIVKLDAAGDEVWTRVIDGESHDYAEGLVLDDQGGLLVAGWTDSADFPTTQAPIGGIHFRDAFVMSLDTEDGSIQWSTKIGGDYTDSAFGIALDDAGEIILVGQTGSTDFPTTADAYQGEPSAPLYVYTDVFVMRLDAQAQNVLYSTYFGGFKDEYPVGMALTPAGDIVFGGRTTSDDFPLANAVQTEADAMFVAELSADGQTLNFGTYFGGGSGGNLWAVTAGPDGDIYLAGSTRAIDFPTTSGAFQPDFVGGILACEEGFPGHAVNCDDGFVARMDPDTGTLVYSTFLGGSRIDESRALAVDANGSACIVGFTGSSDFPGDTPVPYSIFLSRLSPDGGELDFSVFEPSGSNNAGHGVFAASPTEVYFTGADDVPADVYVAEVAVIAATTDAPPPTRGERVRLLPNHPNPFNPATTIAFELPQPETVTLRILDLAGHVVRTLVAGEARAAGRHEVVWRGLSDAGRRVASGVYLYRLEAGGEVEARSMVLLK
jgi:hypothetical protein